ncbi:hypothetical protein TVAG_230240 [Trichomonas vaginalis G3]|uniref:Uncharacterized protein n=1 Tax=Trichomonas vaginalis (strain ATCC PRA-98 / G3) TaxID=412133 RepID=A2F112_TRIV3|nr:hypothetical protein TVAGG3_0324040 [Trichomonas vaginalis G3]EAY01420.1 hypothetical protein TVAG_230240 [Trichomonas vaginalis G3]KAI5529510.1 hypothetical protein TVAGG3_0324040 [Trichomonas vaginalis G3]|eukprot:XP_001330255.1 hypothetical protein [Trichomonas vaginalis G3]
MNDLNSSLISWLKLTGKIEDVNDAFQEFVDYYPLIEAFHELFPEIELDEDNEAASFMKYLVDNRPSSFLPEHDFDYQNFIDCDYDLFEDIVKQILWMMKDRKPAILQDQINKLLSFQQEDLLRFLKSSNSSEEKEIHISSIRDYCRSLDKKIEIEESKNYLKQTITDLEKKISEREGNLNKEKSIEVTEHHQKSEEIKNKNVELQKEIQKLRLDVDKETNEHKNNDNMHITRMNNALSEKTELTRKIEQMSQTKQDEIKLDSEYRAISKVLNASLEQLTEIQNQKEILAKDYEGEKQKIDDYHEKINNLNKKIQDLNDKIQNNKKTLETELYHGETSKMLNYLTEQRNLRDSLLEKLKVLRNQLTTSYGEVSIINK